MHKWYAPAMNMRDLAQAFAGSWATSSAQEPAYERQSIEDIISAQMAQRMEDFTVQDALTMPSVRRAIDIITTIGASLDPQALDPRGVVMENQPAVVRKPDPFTTRYDWTLMSIRSLVEAGNIYWREGDGFTVVLDPEDVEVAWEDPVTKLRRTYTWQGQDITNQVRHVRIGQAPGDLVGTSPLQSCLEALAILDAQERYAAEWFTSGGIPHTVLESDWDLSADEAKALKADYIAARQAGQGVAVLPKGYAAKFPQADPESSQLTDSRDFANTTVARLFGIPGPLMLVQGGSAGSITYSNVAGLVLAFVRETLGPMYMRPIEEALSERVRGTVRYSPAELRRVDITDRVNIYAALQEMGVVDEERIAIELGLDPASVPGKPEVPAPVPAAEPSEAEMTSA